MIFILNMKTIINTVINKHNVITKVRENKPLKLDELKGIIELVESRGHNRVEILKDSDGDIELYFSR